jgi:hypothetical protein
VVSSGSPAADIVIEGLKHLAPRASSLDSYQMSNLFGVIQSVS